MKKNKEIIKERIKKKKKKYKLKKKKNLSNATFCIELTKTYLNSIL